MSSFSPQSILHVCSDISFPESPPPSQMLYGLDRAESRAGKARRASSVALLGPGLPKLTAGVLQPSQRLTTLSASLLFWK